MAGRAGVDTIVALPPGTIVRRRDAGPDEPPLAELLEPGALEGLGVCFWIWAARLASCRALALQHVDPCASSWRQQC
jgi:hypothetical protein